MEDSDADIKRHRSDLSGHLPVAAAFLCMQVEILLNTRCSKIERCTAQIWPGSLILAQCFCNDSMTGRNMGSAGIYLESDYSEECYTDRWYKFLPYVTGATVVFSVGIPAGFLFLVHKYKDRRNDSSSSAALGWMYEPFRRGKEWFLGARFLMERAAFCTAGMDWMLILCVVLCNSMTGRNAARPPPCVGNSRHWAIVRDQNNDRAAPQRRVSRT